MSRIKLAGAAAAVLAVAFALWPVQVLKAWSVELSPPRRPVLRIDRAGPTSLDFNNPTDRPVHLRFDRTPPFEPEVVCRDDGRACVPAGRRWTVPARSQVQTTIFAAAKLVDAPLEYQVITRGRVVRTGSVEATKVRDLLRDSSRVPGESLHLQVAAFLVFASPRVALVALAWSLLRRLRRGPAPAPA